MIEMYKVFKDIDLKPTNKRRQTAGEFIVSPPYPSD
jgi:hypothetical protein